MTQTIEQVLTQAKFYTDGQDYALIQLPSRVIMLAAGILAEVADPFTVLIVDKDEITLMIPDELVVEFEKRLSRVPEHKISDIKYRLITIDLELEPDLVGFMARIATTLAQANVTILPIAAFSRDHLLVPSTQAETALKALEDLKASVSS